MKLAKHFLNIAGLLETLATQPGGLSGDSLATRKEIKNVVTAIREDFTETTKPTYSQHRDDTCATKARDRGQATFTLVSQDRSAAKVAALWIAENIETCPEDKLREALNFCLVSRAHPGRKNAD